MQTFVYRTHTFICRPCKALCLALPVALPCFARLPTHTHTTGSIQASQALTLAGRDMSWMGFRASSWVHRIEVIELISSSYGDGRNRAGGEQRPQVRCWGRWAGARGGQATSLRPSCPTY